MSKKAEKPLQNAKDGRVRIAERPLCKGAKCVALSGQLRPRESVTEDGRQKRGGKGGLPPLCEA